MKSISSLLGFSIKHDKNKNELYYSCSATEIDRMRSAFANLSIQYPQVWMSIPPTERPGSGFFQFNQNISSEIQIAFGCLLSTSKFYTHEISSLKTWNPCTAQFRNGQTFVIDCSIDEKTNGSIRFAFPMKCIDKKILVKEDATHCKIILNIQTITSDVTNGNERYIFDCRWIRKLFLFV